VFYKSKDFMKRSLTVTFGFILFLTGMMALILSLVGVQLSFLTWIDHWGGGVGMIIRLIMVAVGIVLIVLSSTNFSGE